MTGPRDDVASLRRDFASDPAVACAPEACPPPETLWSAIHGELSPAALREVVDHTAACSACAEDWRLAMAVAGEPREVDGLAVRTPRIALFPVSARAFIASLAAAATLGFSALGLQWVQYLEQVQIAKEIRAAGEDTAYRSGERMVLRSRVPNGAALPRSRFLLAWDRVEEAASYDVVVSSKDLLHILAHSRGLDRLEYQVPESSLAGLPSGTQVDWQFTAVRADGKVLASSRTFVARIR